MSDDDLNPICSQKMSDHIGDSKTTTAGYKQIQNIEKQNDETLTKMKFTQDHFKPDQEKATTHEDSTDIISKEIFSNAENAKHENEADYASVICGKVLQDVLSTIGQNVESTYRVSSNVCDETSPNVGQNDNIANEPESKKDDVDNYIAEHQPTIISSPVLNDSLKSAAQAVRHPLTLLAEVALDSTKLIFDKFNEKERDEILSANNESKIDESQTIKIDTVEKDTTETVTFGTNIVESKTNESNTVQNKTIESKTIESNTVENKTVESNNIESKIVESNNVENKTVESNNIESNIVESNSVENKTVESKTVESKTVKNKTVKNKTVETNTIESNTIKGNTVENKTVESNNIKENSFESQTVESQTVETNTIESNTIKGNTVENKTVESNNIKDNSFESKTAESKITTNDSVESDNITVGSNIVESKTDESNTAESKITVNNTVERDTDEGGTVDRDTVESETITLNVEKETLEGTIIESNTVESKSTTNDTAEIDTVVSDIAESQTIESESVKSKTVISETNENKTTETKIVISKTADNKTVRIINAKSAMVTSQNAEEKTIENKNIEMSESDDQVEFCDNLPGQSDEQNETQLQNYLSSNSQSDILLTSLPSENQDPAEIKTTEIDSTTINDVELCPDSKPNDKELKPILPDKDLSCKIVGDVTANLESKFELSNPVDQCKTKTPENVKENTDADCQSKDLGDENANEESSVHVIDKNEMLSSNLEELEMATAATNVPLGIQNLESQITFHNEELITVAAQKTSTEQSELIHGQKIVEINDQFDVNDSNTNDILNETENAEDSTNRDDGLSKVSTVDQIYSSKTTDDRFEASSDKNIIQKNKLVTKNVEEKSDESDVDDDDSEADDNLTIEVEDNLSCAANGKSVISKDNTSNHDISAKLSSTKNSKILSEIANDWSDDSNHSDEVTQTEAENISIEKVCESQLCESQIRSKDVDEKGQNIESEAIVVALESLTEEAAKEILEDSEDISEGTSKVIEKFVDTLAWKERVDPFDKLIETPKDKNKNPEKKAENAESALDLSVLVVEHAPPAMDKESKSVDFTDEDLVESDKMSFSEESEDRASINLPWESLVSESPRPHSGGPNGSGHSSKTSQISSNNSLVVRPSSIIRLDVDDEEKHPMEDVIDEFVEEIIEDERLEQIEETSKQKKSNRKSSKNAEKRKKSKQTAKRSNDETAKNKVSKRKRIMQSSNENSSKKSKVDEENSEKIPETAKTDLKLDDGDDISKIEEFVRTQILSAPIETKSRQETDPNKQVEKGEDEGCSNPTVAIEAKDEKHQKSSSRKKKRRTAMATNKKSKRAKNGTEIQNFEGDIVEKENVEKDKNENDNLSNPEKETANVESQEADKEVTIVQDIHVEKPVEVQGTVESEKSKETQTLNQQPAASNDSNQTKDQSASSNQKDQLNNPRTDSAIFKPVSDWKKVLKYPPNYTDLSNRLIDQQIFKNVLPPYAPCVPSNTSQNLIDHLTERELEQLSCPGCKDRFLLPSSFFQHLYRKSVLINFNCRPCGNVLMSFHNRCHLRTHVLSHLEVDGTSSVVIPDTDSLHVAPLDESQFGIGFVDETYTEELNVIHREHFRTSGQDSTQCPECRLTVNKSGLASHFQNLRKNSSVLECPDCRMNLPNKCSLEAHKRIHQQIAPFICPECGESFETLAFFKNHLASVCFHEARALAILCRLCTNKKSRQNLRQENNDKDPPSATNDNSNNVDEESYVSAKAILGHIYEAHVRMFYKCSFCSKAYVEKSDIYDHGKKMHTDKSDKIVRQKVCDFSLLYKASFLKPPNNLFCTREGFEKKMSNILSKWPKKFLLKCHQCSKYFESVEKFANHDSLWCQKRSRSPMASKLFPDLSNNSTDRRLSDRDRREEMIQHLAHLEALSTNCNDCSKSTIDFRAHLTTHSNPSQARSTNQTRESAAGPPAAVAPPTAVALPATQPAALTVALPVETPQASSATPTRVTRKGLENFSKRGSGSIDSRPGSATENRGSKRRRSQESASEPKDNPPKEDQPEERVEKAAEIIIEEESVRIVSSPVVEPPKRKQGRVANVTKSGRTRRAELKPSVETLGLDVLSNKKLLAFNRLSREALAIGSTVRPIVDKSNKKQKRSKHKCGLCGYKTDCKNTFQTHIIIHKPVVSDATLSFMDTNYKPQEIGKETIQDCLQCKECGMCFASEPSWKKHLFLLHRIKNPGPEHYCMDLVPSTPGPGGLGIEEGDSSDSSLGRLIIDEGQFPCTVCGQDFVNPLELKRHFRTHGMAFLKLRHSPPYKKV